MHYKQLKQGYLIRIMKDEELITELTNFCKEKLISGASLTGIGGVSNCEIAYVRNRHVRTMSFSSW